MTLAEDLGHYWMTSKSSPDAWLDKTEELIRGHGGKILARAFSQAEGRAAYLLGFELDGERYKIVWRVSCRGGSLGIFLGWGTLICFGFLPFLAN
jgi:hypothetical protein